MNRRKPRKRNDEQKKTKETKAVEEIAKSKHF